MLHTSPPHLAGLLAAALVAAGLAVPGPATASPPTEPDPADRFGVARNILPPGQAGTMTATDVARVVASDPEHRQATPENAPANVTDQLAPYDELTTVDPADLADLGRHYKPEVFTVDEVTRQFERGGLTIRWDSHGVPYIHGATDADVAWGAGYAGTLDRMFLQDVLRHVGRARSAEFLGPSEANIAMDQSILRSSFYTEQEAQQQVTQAFAHPDVPGGIAAGQAFIDGINAAQAELCPGGLPTGPACPAEYAVLGRQPTAWTPADVTYVAGLIGGIFGKGGGAEFGNALWLQQLQERFGGGDAEQVYEDFRRREDPEAPTTITARFRYGGEPVDPTKPGVALPDPDGPQAGGTGTRLSGGPLPAIDNLLTGRPELVVDVLGNRLDLGAAARGMSNAALVSGRHTDDGHPVAVFGPQTGYFMPQLWTEMVLVGPSVKARGVAFAGTQLVVQIGRGVDYSWSATSPGFDNVDTVVAPLCEPDRSAASVESEHYLRDGACVPMDRRVHEQLALPTAADPLALPQRLRFLVLRTHHGIVQLRTTVAGAPVAIVHQRSTYLRELDSLVGFARAQNPRHVTDAATFQRAMHGIEYTFNWFYADDRDIAYFGSGRLPERAGGVDWDLPRWSDRAYDWPGFLSFREHPRQINPPTGYLADWNNKQAPGWHAADGNAGYGPVHRSQAIAGRVDRLVSAGSVTPESLAAAVADAAVVDSRAAATLPHLLAVLGEDVTDPVAAAAVDALHAWLADGARRVDRARTGSYRHQQAIAIFDEWWESAPRAAAPRGDRALARDVLRGGLGDLVDALPPAIDDHPRHGLGSAWLASAWYGYLSKELRTQLGEPVRGGLSRAYCGAGSLASCREVLRESLGAATGRVLVAQGVSRVEAISYDKHQDDIRFTVAGVVGVRDIDWQNRPTFQQVARYTGHRSR